LNVEFVSIANYFFSQASTPTVQPKSLGGACRVSGKRQDDPELIIVQIASSKKDVIQEKAGKMGKMDLLTIRDMNELSHVG